MEPVLPHPNRTEKFEGSTSNIQKSAKIQCSKFSKGCEFLVRRLEIGESFPPHPCPLPWGEGEPVGQVHGRNRRQETSLSISSAHRSRSRWHRAPDPNPKPRLV